VEFVEPKINLWGKCPTNQGDALCWIERAARVCYNSEDKTQLGSAKKFVKGILKPVPAHLSVVEHSNIVLRSGKVTFPQGEVETIKAALKSDFIFVCRYKGRAYIYGNYRAFFEALNPDSFFDLPDCVPKFFPGYELVTDQAEIPLEAQAATVQFKTDRAVTHEIVRHRHKTAYSQRSQRYCSESNLEIITPYWWAGASQNAQKHFMLSCFRAEDDYKFLKNEGLKNQAARAVLPNCTSTTIVVTAYMSAWHWFFYLRTSTAAYPGIRQIMTEAKRQMRSIGLEV
jgi:thymidylate synthase ThyX